MPRRVNSKVRPLCELDERATESLSSTVEVLHNLKRRKTRWPSTSIWHTEMPSGRWSGSWTNNKGESGTSTINIREDAGTITGDEDGWVIENGRLSGKVLTWMYRNQSNGCRDYYVRWEIAAAGGTANGTYTVTDRCEGKTYTGKYINYHR